MSQRAPIQLVIAGAAGRSLLVGLVQCGVVWCGVVWVGVVITGNTRSIKDFHCPQQHTVCQCNKGFPLPTTPHSVAMYCKISTTHYPCRVAVYRSIHLWVRCPLQCAA